MVERRSRGKLYLTECRATSKLYTVRFAWLDTMNAGVDDGVPASVLRELNYLKFLENEQVQNLVSAELKNRFVVIQCEYVQENLRNYLQNSPPLETCMRSNKKISCKSTYQVKSLVYSIVKAL